MELPTGLARRGVAALPTLGDGRHSGTSDARPSSTRAPRPRVRAGGRRSLPMPGEGGDYVAGRVVRMPSASL